MGQPRNPLPPFALQPNPDTSSGLDAVEPRQPTVPFPDSDSDDNEDSEQSTAEYYVNRRGHQGRMLK